MSDRPTNNANPGANGSSDDVYRWSGDGQKNIQPQPGQSGQNGDRYIYDGSGGQTQTNGDQQHDAFSRDRMPGRIKESDYPQTFTEREVRGDGTVIINNIHCKNAYFNQSSIDGADYRRDPQQDYRGYDPDYSRLQQRNQSSYYNNSDISPSNGTYRIPPDNYNQGLDYRQMQIDQMRQNQLQEAQLRIQQIEMMRERQNENSIYGQNQINGMSRFHHHRDVEQQLRMQMYGENCRQATGQPIEQQLPYYVNDQGYGNNYQQSYGRPYQPNYGDRYDSGYGGPCFGNSRHGLNLRIGYGGIQIRL
jgi:hypothetical protein